LPRRSARSTAISNLKLFTSQTRKRNPNQPKKSTDKDEKAESDAEASDESEDFDESDEEEDDLCSSDDEFVGPRSKKGRGKKRLAILISN
jgi:hypothetical protein